MGYKDSQGTKAEEVNSILFDSIFDKIIEMIMKTISDQNEGLFDAIQDWILVSIGDSDDLNYFFYEKGAPPDYYADGIYISFDNMLDDPVIMQFYDSYGSEVFANVVTYIAKNRYKKMAKKYYQSRDFKSPYSWSMQSEINACLNMWNGKWEFLQFPSIIGHEAWLKHQQFKQSWEEQK